MLILYLLPLCVITAELHDNHTLYCIYLESTLNLYYINNWLFKYAKYLYRTLHLSILMHFGDENNNMGSSRCKPNGHHHI